jgi:hypothetical protein
VDQSTGAGEVTLINPFTTIDISTMANEEKQAGEYEIEFSINNLQITIGVYFYQLHSGNSLQVYIDTKRMIVME